MHTLHAISVTSRGTYCYVKVACGKHGYKLVSTREWNVNSFFKNYLLMKTGVRLCVPSYFTCQPLPSDNHEMETVNCGPDIYFSTSMIDLESHIGNLGNNLISIHPDDIHLSTLPLWFSNDNTDSFISVFHDDSVIKAGLVIEGILVRVFSSVLSSSQEFEGFIGRIYRSLHIADRYRFPEHLFIIGQLPFDMGETSFKFTRLSCGSDSPDAIKAFGAALAAETAGSPNFSFSPVNSALRIFRTITTACAILLLAGVLVAAIILSLTSFNSAKKLSSIRESYRTILNTNKDIRELIAEGDSLSKLFLDNVKISSHPTRWGTLLHFLGTVHPPGLFFERLGTEPVPGKADAVRLAVAGWSTNETIVTDFVKTLTKSSLLKNVTLSSIDRIEGQESSCTFKITCVYPLLEP